MTSINEEALSFLGCLCFKIFLVSHLNHTYKRKGNNKVLLYTSGSYIKYPAINHNGKNLKKNVYICITESLCCIAEINIVNQLYFSKKKKVKYHLFFSPLNPGAYLHWRWQENSFINHCFMLVRRMRDLHVKRRLLKEQPEDCLRSVTFPAGYCFLTKTFLLRGWGGGWLSGSVQFSPSVVSSSLWPHESQHARPPCPSPTPGVHPNPCPLSQWCHPAISFSVIPFSSCPQSLPASESFPMSQLFSWGGQSTGVSALASVLPWLFRTDFL